MIITLQFYDMTSSPIFFDIGLFILSSLVTGPNFISIPVPGSGVMTIYICKGLTRNLEIGDTPVWVLPNIWRPGQVKDTKLVTDVSNKMLLNAAKCQGYSFYCVWIIKVKSTREGVKLPRPTKYLEQVWKRFLQTYEKCCVW